MSKKYITTAIPYANAAPHIGTAMDYLYGDILARYWSGRGDAVLMSIGTDEHGTKVAGKAADNGVSPQEFVDSLQPAFDEMRRKMNIDFRHIRNVRTSDAAHKKRVQEIWRRLDAAGVIYKSTYEGWYCSGCEAFVTESEAREMDYKCPDHNKPLEKLSEENYYLRVSDFTEQIRDFVKSSVVPQFRGKEILELIKDGAQDVSISRPRQKLAWGIPVPGDDTQVMYVWVDALSNYLTALKYPDVEISLPVIASAAKQSSNNLSGSRRSARDDTVGNARDDNFWPAYVQIVGKDILRFHAIIWPAMLLALGLELPQNLMAHGFINVGGTKMSKSLGNVISPIEIIDRYGVDAFRYYFTRHIPTFEDGDFTWQKFLAAYNGELANDLGNLVSRLANMLHKYEIKPSWRGGQSQITQFIEQTDDFMKKFEFSRAVETIWTAVQSCNKYIDEQKPWELAKSDSAKLGQVLNVLWGDMMTLQSLLEPFLPDTASKIAEIFDVDRVQPAPILFPRVDDESN